MTRDIRKVSVHPSTVLSGKWSAISSARPAIFNDHLGGGFAAAQQTHALLTSSGFRWRQWYTSGQVQDFAVLTLSLREWAIR